MAAHQAPRPWDSPGKNTGVDCHFLLQCRKVKSESEVAQSCPTLRDSMDCSLPGSSVPGIFQARVLEWVAIAFSEKYLTIPQILSALDLSVCLPTSARATSSFPNSFSITCLHHPPLHSHIYHSAPVGILEFGRNTSFLQEDPLEEGMATCLENPMDRGA